MNRKIENHKTFQHLLWLYIQKFHNAHANDMFVTVRQDVNFYTERNNVENVKIMLNTIFTSKFLLI